MAGVAVILEGTSHGTMTSDDGSWSLTIGESDGGGLLFTCLGYADVRETIGGRSRINVKLSESATQLDELVVIGYGTVKKSDLTGVSLWHSLHSQFLF